MNSESWSFETRQIHAGSRPDPLTRARVTPIYQTGSYVFDDTAHASRIFGLEEPGFTYSRVQNPTNQALELRLASLEGAREAIVFASGQAAITTALLNVLGAGGHVVASSALQGGSYNLLHYTLPLYGVETTFIDEPDDLDVWAKAIRPETRIVFGETIGNPRNNLLDVAGVAEVAHAAGVPLMIDNTALTPYLFRPLEYGADLVVHSTSKYLSGHGTVIGGVLLDGGTFDFGADPARFPQFTEPDVGFHGIRYWERYGPGAFARRARARLVRDLGPAAAPMSSFLVLQGIETLSLRMERHVANALDLAQWLENRPEVAAVHYPGLPSSPWHDRATKLLPRGSGGVVAFDMHGGRDAALRLIDGLELISHLVNLGDVRTLAVHPSSTTHHQMSEAQKLVSGVTPGLIRLSVGLEGVADLKADLDHGFAAAGG